MKPNEQLKKGFSTLVLFLLFATTSILAQAHNVAYIHFSNTAKAVEYKSLLDSNGFSTDIIYLWDIDDTDFSNYSLIVIDPDTSFSGYTWPEDWMVTDLQNSELPVLGLGYTGQRLYEKLGLSNNWGNGATGSGTSMVCVDTSFIIYKSPNSLLIPSDTTLVLYNLSTKLAVEYGPSLDASVNKIGKVPSGDYYSITSDQEKYWLWGYADSPENMTQIGKDLFVNIVDYMSNTLVSVDEEGITKPESFKLNQNYPNPFNPSTKISYQLPSTGHVSLVVYDVIGNEVATLVNENQNSGTYNVNFNSSGLTSGIYFYKIITENFTQAHKMILLK